MAEGQLTLAASGGNGQTAAVSAQGASHVALFLNGDVESTNVDIVPQVRHADGDEWHELNGEVLDSQDVADARGGDDAASNEAIGYLFDIRGVSFEFRVVLVNDAGMETVVDWKISRQQ